MATSHSHTSCFNRFQTFIPALNWTVREKKLETKNTVSTLRVKTHAKLNARYRSHATSAAQFSSTVPNCPRGKIQKQICAAPEALLWGCAVVPHRVGAPTFPKRVKMLLDAQAAVNSLSSCKSSWCVAEHTLKRKRVRPNLLHCGGLLATSCWGLVAHDYNQFSILVDNQQGGGGRDASLTASRFHASPFPD